MIVHYWDILIIVILYVRCNYASIYNKVLNDKKKTVTKHFTFTTKTVKQEKTIHTTPICLFKMSF